MFKKITAGPFQENGYIVYDDNKLSCIIIDPGYDHEQYISVIEKTEIKPVAILNTHGHIDHVHAVQPLKQYFSIPFYIHSNEEMVIEHYQQSCQIYGMTPNEIPEIDNWLTDEDSLQIDIFDIKLIHTPGHTPGGVCYQINNDIFTGDTLFKGSVGRTDLPGGNYSTLMTSIAKLIKEVPAETEVHAGHGFSSTIGDEISTNPFLQN